MSGRVTALDLDRAKDAHRELLERYLRQHGFELTCKTPGSLWLWTRERDGQSLLVDAELALVISASDDAIVGLRSAHEFSEDGRCVHCHLVYDAFERAGFVGSCLPAQEQACARD